MINFRELQNKQRLQELATENKDSLQSPTPNFRSLFDLTVPPNGNIFIDNVIRYTGASPDCVSWNTIARESNRDIMILSAMQLSEGLLKLMPDAQFFKKNRVARVLIYDGSISVVSNLSEYLQERTPFWIKNEIKQPSDEMKEKAAIVEKLPTFYFSSERTPRNNGRKVNLVSGPISTINNFDYFMFMDDILLTGNTVRGVQDTLVDTLFQNESFRKRIDSCGNYDIRSEPFRQVPMPQFMLYTWMALDPKRRQKLTGSSSPSSLAGFDSVNTVISYKGGQGIPPCNTLNTLFAGLKCKEVREDLESRYFYPGALWQTSNCESY